MTDHQQTPPGGGPSGSKPARPSWLPTTRTLIVAATALGLSAVLGIFLITSSRPVGAPVISTGKALVGGPFEMVDHTGKTVTQADYEGKYLLIYFGFTFCPDVCPTALQVMSAALDRMGEKADAVQPLFITIDPERDTVENMAAYVNHFHPRLVGLTGTLEQVRKTARAYRVIFKKVRESGASDYTMDHSSVVYLMDPDGAFLASFNHTTTPDDMARVLSEKIKPQS